MNGRKSNRIGRVSCLVAGVLMLAQLTGCAGWTATPASPDDVVQLVRKEKPNSVRVTRDDGDQLVVWYPRVEADTLAGYANADSLRGGMIRMPLSEIDQLAVREAGGGKTALLVVGVLAGAIVVFAILGGSSFLGGSSGGY